MKQSLGSGVEENSSPFQNIPSPVPIWPQASQPSASHLTGFMIPLGTEKSWLSWLDAKAGSHTGDCRRPVGTALVPGYPAAGRLEEVVAPEAALSHAGVGRFVGEYSPSSSPLHWDDSQASSTLSPRGSQDRAPVALVVLSLTMALSLASFPSLPQFPISIFRAHIPNTVHALNCLRVCFSGNSNWKSTLSSTLTNGPLPGLLCRLLRSRSCQSPASSCP